VEHKQRKKTLEMVRKKDKEEEIEEEKSRIKE